MPKNEMAGKNKRRILMIKRNTPIIKRMKTSRARKNENLNSFSIAFCSLFNPLFGGARPGAGREK
jgi:hypothetical protein